MKNIDISNKSRNREKTNTHSALTLKNYASDIRRFIRWYSQTYSRPFPPKVITKEIIDSYLDPLYQSSPRSAKRYASSLRKFFAYLHSESKISYNPLTNQGKITIQEDLWHIRDFSNFLYTSKKNSLTIKNYISDINQFLKWLEAISFKSNDMASHENASSQQHPFANIQLPLVIEYKNRLVNAKLSPSSINRKLSSLRQYFIWAAKKGFFNISTEVATNLQNIPSQHNTDYSSSNTPNVEPPGLMDLQNINIPTSRKSDQSKIIKYSTFAPLRLIQKTNKIFGLVFDAIFVISILRAIENLKLNLWKATGKEIFASVPEVMRSIQKSANSISGSYSPSIKNSVKNDLAKRSYPKYANSSGLDKLIRLNNIDSLEKIKGLPKSVYAPYRLSIKTLPFQKKIIYHIRHTRPYWYKKYHNYSFAHYLHFAIIVIIAVILGLRIYQPFLQPNTTSAVLGSQIEPYREISFEGSLADKDGLPITKTSKIRFTIYNDKIASGSALLWEEIKIINPEPTGKFSIILGQENKIKQSIFTNNPALFLGITIGSEPELTPRESLASYLLSANSNTLQGLKPITGNNAGTENVILALDSSGNLTIGGNANPIFQATGGNLSLSGEQLILSTNPGTDGNVILNPDGAGFIDLRKPIQNTSKIIIDEDGSEIDLAVKIDDNLEIYATSSAQPALHVNQNGTGELLSASTAGSAKFTVSNSGTLTLAEDLKIFGNNISTSTNTFSIATKITKIINFGNEADDINIGGTTGTTKINHNLKVLNEITAEKGINLPYLESGSITFLNDKKQLSGDIKNFFWDNKNNRLGLGTNIPASKLSVLDDVSAQGKAVGSFTNKNSADNLNTVALRINLGVSQASTQARFLSFYTDCKTSDCAGVAKGNIAVTASGVSYNSGSADFAEYFKKADPNEKFEEGDVICFAKNTGVEKCNIQSNGILGVYSKDAGFVGASNFADNPEYVLVGLIGQLKVKVAKDDNRINQGDPIAVSNEGKGVKAVKAGQIVGRALESYSIDKNLDLIKISLNVSWYDPSAILLDNGSLALAYDNNIDNEASMTNGQNQLLLNDTVKVVKSIQNFIDTLENGLLRAGQITTNSLVVTTENITIGTETLKNYIKRIVNEEIDNRILIAKISEPENQIIINPIVNNELSPSPASTASATPSITSSPDPIDRESSEAANITYITNIYNNISSSSANIASSSASSSNSSTLSPTPTISPVTPILESASSSASITPSPMLIEPTNKQEATKEDYYTDLLSSSQVATFSAELHYVPNLRASLGRFDNGLIALGPTSLTDLTVSTQIVIGGNLKISNTGFDAIGTDLNLQSLRQGNLNIMGGLISIDTKGNLSVEGDAEFARNVNINGKLTAGLISPIAGSDSIKISGNIEASGSAKFIGIETESIKIVRGVQADTSFTETVASGSAGTAIITSNELERTILTPFVTENSLIYLTPLTDTKGITPYIARQTPESPSRKTKGSFTIQIPTPQLSEIKVNWIIIN